MSYFIPGKVIKEFTTKNGQRAQLIYPKWELLDQLLTYINTLSAEDTFLTVSGEQFTLKEETEYFASVFVNMTLEQKVYLYCLIDGELAGTCEVSRQVEQRKRGYHIGGFGLSVAKKFRGEGIGFELAQTTIEEAKLHIEGLRMITLNCFANNEVALKLYRKLGFVETGRTPQGILSKGNYIDEVHMTLQLV